jgi:geranylgeranyl transferase type-1 subunit beta
MSTDTVEVVPLSAIQPPGFDKDKLVKFFMRSLFVIPNHYQSQDPNRLTLLYFTISGLDILGALDKVDNKERIIDWIYSLQVLPSADQTETESAQWGFRGSTFFGNPYDPSGKSPEVTHFMDDGHIAMTYSALCILVILGDDLGRVNRKAILSALRKLQQEDGCFSSTSDSESDMRFLFCASAISTFLNDWSGMDVEKARKYIVGAMGFDFAYGQSPGEESHGGSTYCAIASLALMGKLEDLGFGPRSVKEAAGYVNASSETSSPLTSQAQGLLHWLVQRQVSGFQGRINKDQDSCYSWWIGATLQMLGFFDVVELVHLKGFVLSCQHQATGGFAKHPDHSPDALHTYFSLCGLAFAGVPGLERPHCALGITLRAAKQLPHLQLN